jgi:hypothetical protein
VSVTLTLFFLQLLLQRGTTLELETGSNTLHPQIYFQTAHNKYYNEKNSVKPFSSNIARDGKYTFDIRNMKEFRKLRVDPDTRSVHVSKKYIKDLREFIERSFA